MLVPACRNCTVANTDVKELFNSVHKELGNTEIVCEVANRYWVNKMNNSWMKWKFEHQLGMTGGTVFTFGVPDSRYFERWNHNFKFIDEWTYFDDHTGKLGWFNLFSSVKIIRKAQWTVHYRLIK